MPCGVFCICTVIGCETLVLFVLLVLVVLLLPGVLEGARPVCDVNTLLVTVPPLLLLLSRREADVLDVVAKQTRKVRLAEVLIESLLMALCLDLYVAV